MRLLILLLLAVAPMTDDEGQWNNLANDPDHAAAKAGLVKWLPRENAPAQSSVPRKND